MTEALALSTTRTGGAAVLVIFTWAVAALVGVGAEAARATGGRLALNLLDLSGVVVLADVAKILRHFDHINRQAAIRDVRAAEGAAHDRNLPADVESAVNLQFIGVAIEFCTERLDR